MCTCGTLHLNLAFFHKIDPLYNQILRAFYVMLLFDMRLPECLGDPQLWGCWKYWISHTNIIQQFHNIKWGKLIFSQTKCYFYFINTTSLAPLLFPSILFFGMLFCLTFQCCPIHSLIRAMQSVMFNYNLRHWFDKTNLITDSYHQTLVHVLFAIVQFHSISFVHKNTIYVNI